METTNDTVHGRRLTSPRRLGAAGAKVVLVLTALLAALTLSLQSPAQAVQWGSHGRVGQVTWERPPVNCMYHRIGVPSQYGTLYVGKSSDVGTFGSQAVYAHMIVKRWNGSSWGQYGTAYLNYTLLPSGLTSDSVFYLQGSSVSIRDAGYYQVILVLDWGQPGTSSYRGTMTLNMNGLTNSGAASNDYTGQYRGASNYCYFPN